MNKELIVKGIGVAATLAATYFGGHYVGQSSTPQPVAKASGPLECVIKQPIPVRIEVVPLVKK